MLGLVAALFLAGAAVPGAPDLSPDRAPDPVVELTFDDPAIVESSGLVVDATSGLFVTTNDSGDDGRLFVVDPATGGTVGVTTWRSSTGASDPVDVEALAPAGPGEVWVADIGDNDAVRDVGSDAVRLFRVPVGPGERDVLVEAYVLAYPDGPRDAESLLLDPDGRALVVTKGLFGGEVLRTEQPLATDRVSALRRIGVALPIATDAAFFPDGRHLVVRSYGSAAVYAYPSLTELGSFELPDQEQGEGIAVDEEGAVFLSSEGEGSSVLRLRLPADVRRAMAPAEPVPSAPEPEAAPGPEVGAGEDPAEDARENAAEDGSDVPLWRWGLGGLGGLGALVVLGIALVRARPLRPRG